MSVFSADDGSRLCRLAVVFQKMGLKLAVDARPNVHPQPIEEAGINTNAGIKKIVSHPSTISWTYGVNRGAPVRFSGPTG
jgi:hypothetical protein